MVTRCVAALLAMVVLLGLDGAAAKSRSQKESAAAAKARRYAELLHEQEMENYRGRDNALFGKLTWDLFVHLSNTCFTTSDGTELAECIVQCSDAADSGRIACAHALEQGTCGQLLLTCIQEAMEAYKAPPAGAPPPKLAADSLPSFAAVAEHPEGCCNASFLQVDPSGPDAATDAAAVMRQCGFVIFPGLIGPTIAEGAARVINSTLADVGYFQQHYIFDGAADVPTKAKFRRKISKWHSQLAAGTSAAVDVALGNLRAGRFEVVLPPEPAVDALLTGLHDSPLPRMLSTLWGGDQPKLLCT